MVPKSAKQQISIALAVLAHLKEQKFNKAARSLETELKKRYNGSLPTTKHPVHLRWEFLAASSTDSGIDDGENAQSFAVKPPSRKLNGSNKKPRTSPEEQQQTKKVEVVTPEEESDSDEDDVSDTDVSDVSSVDVSSSSSESSDDDSSDGESSFLDEKAETKLLAKRRDEAVRKARDAAEAARNWKPSPRKMSKSMDKTDLSVVKTAAGTDGAQVLGAKGKPFKRVDSDYWGADASNFGGAIADNSYEGAFGSSGFGARSSEKLIAVRGKDFRHEKTKRKRSFNGFARTGGQIDTNKSFSTKFQYSDDEQ